MIIQLYDIHICLSSSICSIDLHSLWRAVRGKCPHQGDIFMHHISAITAAAVGVTMSCFYQIQSHISQSDLMFLFPQNHRKSFWRVEPSEGEVPPETQLELCVVAHLKDIIHFQDTLEVSIQDGQRHTVPLSATGTGTTIVSDRPLAPSLDLGTHLR